MAFPESDRLIDLKADSMVIIGENLKKNNKKELKKMHKEIIEPNLDASRTGIATVDLLPKFI